MAPPETISTDGIDIGKWQIDVEFKGGVNPVEMSVWDFAGLLILPLSLSLSLSLSLFLSLSLSLSLSFFFSLSDRHII